MSKIDKTPTPHHRKNAALPNRWRSFAGLYRKYWRISKKKPSRSSCDCNYILPRHFTWAFKKIHFTCQNEQLFTFCECRALKRYGSVCHYSCQKSVPTLWLNWRWQLLGWAYLQEENRWRNFAGPLEKSGALLSIGIHTPRMNLAGVCGLAWSLPSHSDKKIPIDNLKERRRITLALSFETGGRKKVG